MSSDDNVVPFPRDPLDDLSLYILEGHAVKGPVRWREYFAWQRTNPETRVASTALTEEIWISTVFLGMDHSFSGSGPPLLFETRIFGGPSDKFQKRCSTWEEAEALHAEAVELSCAR